MNKKLWLIESLALSLVKWESFVIYRGMLYVYRVLCDATWRHFSLTGDCTDNESSLIWSPKLHLEHTLKQIQLQLINLSFTFLSSNYCYEWCLDFFICNFLISNKIEADNWGTTLDASFTFQIMYVFVMRCGFKHANGILYRVMLYRKFISKRKK